MTYCLRHVVYQCSFRGDKTETVTFRAADNMRCVWEWDRVNTMAEGGVKIVDLP